MNTLQANSGETYSLGEPLQEGGIFRLEAGQRADKGSKDASTASKGESNQLLSASTCNAEAEASLSPSLLAWVSNFSIGMHQPRGFTHVRGGKQPGQHACRSHKQECYTSELIARSFPFSCSALGVNVHHSQQTPGLRWQAWTTQCCARTSSP
jgi:hypothetical protein